MPIQEPPENKTLGQTPARVPIDVLPVVELTDDQFSRARKIAQKRNRSYKPIDGGRVCGRQSSEDAHLTGVIGEVAFAVKNDDAIDESIYEYGDDGYDFRDGEGSIRIDVKTTATEMQRPSLIVSPDPTPSADIYFLLHRVAEKKVRIIGFTTYATLTEREAIPKPGDALNFVVPQDELRLPPSLDRAMTER